MQIKFNPKGRDHMNFLTFLSRLFSALAHAMGL